MNVNLTSMEMANLIALVEVSADVLGKTKSFEHICIELRKSIGVDESRENK